jgi:hypothetical protein
MKTKQTILLLFISGILFAQDSFEEKQARMQASLKILSLPASARPVSKS